jgi:hypothetical protein
VRVRQQEGLQDGAASERRKEMRRRPYDLDDVLGETIRSVLDGCGEAWLERLFSHTIRRDGREYPKYYYAVRIPRFSVAFVISKQAFEYGVRNGVPVNVDGEEWMDTYRYVWWSPVE